MSVSWTRAGPGDQSPPTNGLGGSWYWVWQAKRLLCDLQVLDGDQGSGVVTRPWVFCNHSVAGLVLRTVAKLVEGSTLVVAALITYINCMLFFLFAEWYCFMKPETKPAISDFA